MRQKFREKNLKRFSNEENEASDHKGSENSGSVLGGSAHTITHKLGSRDSKVSSSAIAECIHDVPSTTLSNDRMDVNKWKRKSVYISKKTKQVKVRCTVTIRKDLYDKVATLAPKVYGVIRGAMELVIEDALELWLVWRGNAPHVINPRAPLRERYNAVLKCLEYEIGYVPVTVPQLFIEKCIQLTYNVKDPRTIHGWLHRFYNAGLIKPLTIDKPTKPSHWARNKSVEIVARRL